MINGSTNTLGRALLRFQLFNIHVSVIRFSCAGKIIDQCIALCSYKIYSMIKYKFKIIYFVT